MTDSKQPPQRVLLLTTPHSYRAEAFVQAGAKLGIDVIQAVDTPAPLAEQWGMRLGVDFKRPDTAVAQLVAYARERPLAAILAVDDSGALLAARASRALGLPHNDVAAAEAARDKYLMRQRLAAGGVAVPCFRRFATKTPIEAVTAAVTESIGFPCVVKPLHLNGSRGVIRADDAGELAAAVTRVRRLLHSIEAEPAFLVEQFIPGFEVALEGVLDNGRLHVLALFDKPDPLDGPYFEETIYVTPSRLSPEVQDAIVETAAQAARALGLRTGPVHAELRVNDEGPWIVEVAGRSIGGLCGQTLHFEMNMSLEELLLRQACHLEIGHWQREERASGVMMIPIPRAGMLRGYSGIKAAEAVPGVDEITITAPLHNLLTPLPEGESYLGFIFASSQTPAFVEEALRQAHACLHFEIEEMIPLRLNLKS